jgi:hypothetical protein
VLITIPAGTTRKKRSVTTTGTIIETHPEPALHIGAVGPVHRLVDRPTVGRSFSSSPSATTSTWATGVGVADLRQADPHHPSACRTNVITEGVDPQISCYDKSSKQYFKKHRASRTETVIGNTRDLGVGRRVTAKNSKARRAAGGAGNHRLYDAQAAEAGQLRK